MTVTFGRQPFGTNAGGGIPPGVVFQTIDGGNTYYATNGLTIAASVTGGNHDSPIFYPTGFWPAELISGAEVNVYNDLAINVCTSINSGSTQAALGLNANQISASFGNGLNPWGGIWNYLLVSVFSAYKAWVDAIGDESPVINIRDEPSTWTNDVRDTLSGVAVDSYIKGTSGTITTAATHRALYVNYLDSIKTSAVSGTPNNPVTGTPTPSASVFSNMTDPAGNTRHVEIYGSDVYWITAVSDAVGSIGCGCTLGNFYQLGYINSNTGANNNVLTTSFTVPALPATGVTFTTRPGLQVQIGASVQLNFGGGAGTSVVGTVTGYTTATGVCTINIPTNFQYTCVVGAGGTVGNGGGGTTTLPLNQICLAAVGQAGGIDTNIQWVQPMSQVVTDVTSPGRIPGGTTFVSYGTVDGPFTTNRLILITLSANTTVQAGDTIAFASTTNGAGPGPFDSGTGFMVAHFSMTADLIRRGVHYGNWVDAFRGLTYSVPPGPPNPTNRVWAPMIMPVETEGPFTTNIDPSTYIKPTEMNQAYWSQVMHGARGGIWFNQSAAGPLYGVANGVQSSFGMTIQSGDTISHYDQLKVTNLCIFKLAPIINARFAFNYVSVSPNGFAAPWPGSYVQNDSNIQNSKSTGFNGVISGNSTPSLNDGVYNMDLALLNGAGVASFEVTGKYYEGTTQTYQGISYVQNKFWIFAAYRGSGADTNKTATFTIGNTGASSVTRIYLDIVQSAASSNAGATTRLGVGNSSQMVTGDTALIENTSGIAGLNGTFTVTVIDSTHVDINLTWPGGTLGSTHGTILTTHNLSVSSGTSFSDTWTNGTDIRIYRVN